MDTLELTSWPAQKLVREAWHELNQKSAIAMSFMEVLLREDLYGFTSAKQKDLLVQLQEEIRIIRLVTDLMGEWIQANRDKQ